MTNKNNTHSIIKIIITLIFLIMLYLPLCQNLFSIFPENNVKSENRMLTQKPKIAMNHLDAFPNAYNLYYEDHFAFRALFMNQFFKFKLFQQKSPTDNVLLGENDFLFSGKEEKFLYQGEDNVTISQVYTIRDNLLNKANELKKRGIKFYCVVVPTTFEIYPENLPIYIQRVNMTSTDKICFLMKSYPDIPFIYLNNYLLSKKSEGQLYRKNDNHWNQLAAYYASDTLLKMIKKDFPIIPIYPKAAYQFNSCMNKKGNLSEMLMINNTENFIKEDVLYEATLIDSTKRSINGKKRGYPPPKKYAYPEYFEIVKEVPNTNFPKAVIIRDSYTESLIPFISNSFSKSVYIWDSWQYKDNFEIIDTEKPNLVLYIIYEPYLKNLRETN